MKYLEDIQSLKEEYICTIYFIDETKCVELEKRIS